MLAFAIGINAWLPPLLNGVSLAWLGGRASSTGFLELIRAAVEQ